MKNILKLVFSNFKFIALSITIFISLMITLLFVSEFIFFEPFFISHLPNGSELGFVLILILSILSALAIVVIMGWSLLPTLDYIDWMKMRKTTTVKIPFFGNKIPLKYIFSIYGIFLLSIIIQYAWKIKKLLNNQINLDNRFTSLNETK